MRRLTVKREKEYAAHSVKVRLFAEDAAGDTVIGGASCRLLGEVGNGVIKTFEISDRGGKLFAVADYADGSMCSDFCELPAGQDDVFLSGKGRTMSDGWHAFCFDDFCPPDASRGNGSHAWHVFLSASIIVGLTAVIFLSYLASSMHFGAKSFEYREMSITLTQDFSEDSSDGSTAYYISDDVAVFVQRDPFSSTPEVRDYSAEEYAGFIFESAGTGGYRVESDDGLTYFQYNFTDPESEYTFHYVAYIYKSDNAFWLVTFAVEDYRFEEFAGQISYWAESVEFSS